MKKSEVKVGMKVVPIRKTATGWEGLENSWNWRQAKKMGQPYLYVHYLDEEENAWCVGVFETPDTGGDFFRASDLHLYVE